MHDKELKPLQVFPDANQSELKFKISAFRWILSKYRSVRTEVWIVSFKVDSLTLQRDHSAPPPFGQSSSPSQAPVVQED